MRRIKGIIIFALGHPYYGRLAFNLAVTLKAAGDIPITVVRTERSLAHLSARQLSVFDNIVDLPDGVPAGCGAKLWANEIAPYDSTLLLDADMLWLPKKQPFELFEHLAGTSFTAITEGYYDYETGNHNIHPKYFFWADPLEIKQKYKVKADKIYQWRSEVMYFEKGAGKLFKTAQKVFLKHGLASHIPYATGVADELGINIAAAVHDIHPHVFNWQPSYWHLMGGGHIPDFQTLYGKWYLMSFGGNTATGASKNMYDRLVKAACYKTGFQHVFALQSKIDYLKERKTM